MTIDALRLPPSGCIPNHPILPVLIYRAVQGADCSDFFEQCFEQNGWKGVWRNGVFAYHHYHTNAHEVLGVGRGDATLQIGGPDGPLIFVKRGDCLLLPAGTGHRRLECSQDFQVVGAYPEDVEVDVVRAAATQEMLKRLIELAIPERDPVLGLLGGLKDNWPGL